MNKRLFTSESVTEGHPDKLCDQVSDAILDALIAKDPMSRVACETCTNTGFVLVMGEITTNAKVNIEEIVRKTVLEIGYDKVEYGFDGNTCEVIVKLDKQSEDIAMGVNKALEAKEENMTEEKLNIVAAGLADKCEIQLSYAIGVAHPTSIMVDTFGTGKIADEKIVEIVQENIDLRPAGIIQMLDLRKPIYQQTASYGHFGRIDLDLPWEKLDKVNVFKKYLPRILYT